MTEENEIRQAPDVNQELQLVKEMILRTKQTVVDRGAFFLLWGGLVFAACLATFALLESERAPLVWLPWATVLPIGVIVSIVLMRRYTRRSKYRSYAEHSYDSIWLACGLAFFIIIFVNGFAQTFPPEAVYPLISFIAGIGAFASGGIMEWYALRVGGLFLWAGAVTMMLVPFHYHPLIMAVALVPGYMIPGFLLRRQFRGQNQDTGA